MSEMVNCVRVCGYLRENNLVVATRNGTGVVRGNVVIAVEEANYPATDVRVDYYASAGTKLYNNLMKMLPTVALSYAAIKTQYPTMTDEEVKAKATKVDALGSLEENVFKGRDGNVVSTTRVKGFGLFAKEGDFTPYENITATAYVETLNEETDKDGAATGRLALTLCIPNCYTKRDGTAVKDAYRVKMVCVNPVADYLATYCVAGSTLPLIARFTTRTNESANLAPAAPVVGVNNTIASTVSVVQEVEIIGVSVNPVDYTETNGFDPADVREMLASRAVRVEAVENATANTPSSPAPAGPTFTGRVAFPAAQGQGVTAGLSAGLNATPAPNFGAKLNDIEF